MENQEIFQMDQLLKEKEEFEQEKIAWNKIHIQKANDLKKKLDDLLKIQSNLNTYNNIPSYLDNSLNKKDEDTCSKLKLEIDKLKFDYDSKLNTYEVLKKNFKREKDDFEITTKNIMNDIKAQQIIIEKRNIELMKKESEIEQRNNDFIKKENELNDKYEDYKKIKDFVREQNIKNLKDEKDLENAEYKKNVIYNKLLDEDNQIQDEKNIIDEEINKITNTKNDIINEKQEIEEIKKEINLRTKCLDDLCSKKISQQFKNIDILSNNINKIFDKNKDDYINGANIYDSNFNQNNKFDKFKNKNNFNSELYLLKIKNRIDINKIMIDDKYGISSKKFDPIKEQEYLIKSYESLNKIKK